MWYPCWFGHLGKVPPSWFTPWGCKNPRAPRIYPPQGLCEALLQEGLAKVAPNIRAKGRAQTPQAVTLMCREHPQCHPPAPHPEQLLCRASLPFPEHPCAIPHLTDRAVPPWAALCAAGWESPFLMSCSLSNSLWQNQNHESPFMSVCTICLSPLP